MAEAIQQYMVGNRLVAHQQYHGTIEQEVEFMFTGWPEGEGIGSSDISCLVFNILDSLQINRDSVGPFEWQRLRSQATDRMRDFLNEHSSE